VNIPLSRPAIVVLVLVVTFAAGGVGGWIAGNRGRRTRQGPDDLVAERVSAETALIEAWPPAETLAATRPTTTPTTAPVAAANPRVPDATARAYAINQADLIRNLDRRFILGMWERIKNGRLRARFPTQQAASAWLADRVRVRVLPGSSLIAVGVEAADMSPADRAELANALAQGACEWAAEQPMTPLRVWERERLEAAFRADREIRVKREVLKDLSASGRTDAEATEIADNARAQIDALGRERDQATREAQTIRQAIDLFQAPLVFRRAASAEPAKH
jgi:hypothetical protein